jgi:hypothetical protein
MRILDRPFPGRAPTRLARKDMLSERQAADERRKICGRQFDVIDDCRPQGAAPHGSQAGRGYDICATGGAITLSPGADASGFLGTELNPASRTPPVKDGQK